MSINSIDTKEKYQYWRAEIDTFKTFVLVFYLIFTMKTLSLLTEFVQVQHLTVCSVAKLGKNPANLSI